MDEKMNYYRELILSEGYSDYIVPIQTNLANFFASYPELAPQEINPSYGLIHIKSDLDPYERIKTFGLSSIPKLFTLLDTTSLDVSGITQAQTQPYLNLNGDGIIMGYIDTGINYTLDAFLNSDGSTRIISIWDQTIQSPNPPEDFYYGTEYTKEQINQALANKEDPYTIVPSKDTNGHGTFIAGVGSGTSDQRQNFTGVAPKCDIAVVKLKRAKRYLKEFFFANPTEEIFQENDIMLGLRYLSLLGKKLNKPVVICISLGTNQGDHAGNTAIESMIFTLPNIYTNTIAVVAGGNESGKAHHFQGIVKNDKDYRDMEILVPSNCPGFTMELWGLPPTLYTVSIITPLGETVPKIAPRLGKSEEVDFVLDQTMIQLIFELVQNISGSQLIFIRFITPTAGIWKIRVYCSSCGTPSFHSWLPVSNLLIKDVSFLEANPFTTITIPGYAINAITSGTYNAYDNSMFLFSGRGFSSIGLIKPDLSAPGVNVQGPGLIEGYVIKSGSSVAAAILAGAVALLWQWGYKRIPPRYFNAQEIKVFFIRGATRSETMEYPNPEWGYGALNLYNIFTSLINP